MLKPKYKIGYSYDGGIFVGKIIRSDFHKHHSIEIDQRILKCIQCIRETDDSVNLEKMSEQVYLSPSRLSHLFKKETGLTYRQFLLHSKMVKSLHAIYNQCNLSEASFFGGFSDQPHFIKTFKNNFGIKPSNL